MFVEMENGKSKSAIRKIGDEFSHESNWTIINQPPISMVHVITSHSVAATLAHIGMCEQCKKGPWECLGYIGDFATQFNRDCFICHEIRIFINQL